MSEGVEKILEDIARGRIKIDPDFVFILPATPERYLFQDGKTVLIRHE